MRPSPTQRANSIGPLICFVARASRRVAVEWYETSSVVRLICATRPLGSTMYACGVHKFGSACKSAHCRGGPEFWHPTGHGRTPGLRRLGPTVSVQGVAAGPTKAELEQAINRYLGAQPANEPAREGKLYVTVKDVEAVKWPPDSKKFRCGLFFSVPFLGADRTRLDQALARVRKGFKHNEILPGWHGDVRDDKPYPHNDDELGARLLTLPVILTLEAAAENA